jgi:hypothetical protein
MCNPYSDQNLPDFLFMYKSIIERSKNVMPQEIYMRESKVMVMTKKCISEVRKTLKSCQRENGYLLKSLT